MDRDRSLRFSSSLIASEGDVSIRDIPESTRMAVWLRGFFSLRSAHA
jgi:hypothetical protein